MSSLRFLDPPAGRPASAWSHRAFQILPALAALDVASAFTRWLGAPSWAAPYLDVPVVLLVVVFVYAFAEHRGLCAVCAANVPLDPQRAIAHRRPLLWSWHLMEDRIIGHGPMWQRVARFAVFFAAVVFAGRLTGEPAQSVIGALLVVFTATVTFVHGQLSVWCPWCRTPDADSEAAPVPPVPTGRAST